MVKTSYKGASKNNTNDQVYDKAFKYQFIPLESEKSRFNHENFKESEKFTGFLNIELNTVSPIIIPNTTNDTYYDMNCLNHKSYGFYSYEDLSGTSHNKNEQKEVPIIPGSTLRGTIRNLHEIICNSCLSSLANNYTILKPIKNKSNNKTFYKTLFKLNQKDFCDKCLEGYMPCNDQVNICETCKLFGTIKTNPIIVSRVRFSDLFLDEKCSNISYQKLTLPVLGSPNPGIIKYYYENDVQPNGINDFNNQIKGRKIYKVNEVNVDNKKPSSANVTVTPIQKGLKFHGKIYFEQITKRELETLIQSITLGDNKHFNQIGMGKPFGYGVVSIEIPSIYLRNLYISNDIINYKTIKYEFKKGQYISIESNNNVLPLVITPFTELNKTYIRKLEEYTKYPDDKNKKD